MISDIMMWTSLSGILLVTLVMLWINIYEIWLENKKSAVGILVVVLLFILFVGSVVARELGL